MELFLFTGGWVCFQAQSDVEYTDCISTEGLVIPQWVSWYQHLAIWRWGSGNAGALENVEYPIIAMALRSTLPRSDSTW